MVKHIQAGKFKAQCLKIMDEVGRTKRPVIITKRNIPVAELIPVKKEKTSILGKMKGTIHYQGEIIDSIGESWDADT